MKNAPITFRRMACSALLLSASVHAAPLDNTKTIAQEKDIAYCGHEIHDGSELRQHAANLTHWRDPHAANPEGWARFKILGFNDFHGQLESLSVAGRPAGGAAVLAAYLHDESKEVKGNAVIVHAGDHVGATPPVSALLQDEPSITFLNMLANKHCQASPEHSRASTETHQTTASLYDHRYDQLNDNRYNSRCNIVGTLGNHEFDEGVAELKRLLDGGNHVNGPFLQENYRGANVPYINANVVNSETNDTLLPPYVIKRLQGFPIAFIGAVLKETPTIVTPSGVAGVKFLDEAEAINRLVPELQRQGIRAIVVSIHQGARQNFYDGPTQDDRKDISGPIADIISRLDSEIDIVVSGHAHGFTNQLVSNAEGKQILLTQAFSRGTAYADIDIAIDPASKDIVEKSARVLTTWADEGPGLAPNAAIAAMTEQAAASVAPLVNLVVGSTSGAITRSENAAGESALGNLIADAQRSATATDFSFMNPGGIRADLSAGEITWGELFTLQPFNNDLVTMTLSGAQIHTLLEQQWLGQSRPRILKTSGIEYTWDASAADGAKISNITTADGTALDPSASYSVTVNSFIASGGDNFTVLTTGAERLIGPVDLDALIAYIGTLAQPFSASIEGRIHRLN